MWSEEPPSGPAAPLGERIAKLEGIVEAEDRLLEAQDRLLERGLDTSNRVQTFIIGIVGLVVAGSLAMLVYVLQRLDAISAHR